MKITIVQPDIVWENKPRNFKKLEKLISPAFNKTDIVVLPEMFTTGFSMNPGELSEPTGSETFDWMVTITEKGNFGLCGSYIVEENNSFFNRWIFVSTEKESWHYDKRHLFTMGDENAVYTLGRKRLIFSFRGVRILPNVCYDLRFPVWSRNRNEYDLLINSANWPESRRDVWNTLLKARAIENQCYVAGVNRVGIDGNGIKYAGDSIIISPKGKRITGLDKNIEGMVTEEISISELNDFRKKFPVLHDADNFTFNY